MSFSASAKRARDARQPLGLRVTCLHNCLDQFNLFGFLATRERLRARVGATQPGWTAQQVTDSLALLEQARSSWLAFARAEAAHRRTLKRHGRRTPDREAPLTYLAWLETYLRGNPARTWMTTSLGNCPGCGHPQIHHNDYGCRACLSSGTTWDQRCKIPIPTPQTLDARNTYNGSVTRH